MNTFGQEHWRISMGLSFAFGFPLKKGFPRDFGENSSISSKAVPRAVRDFKGKNCSWEKLLEEYQELFCFHGNNQLNPKLRSHLPPTFGAEDTTPPHFFENENISTINFDNSYCFRVLVVNNSNALINSIYYLFMRAIRT